MALGGLVYGSSVDTVLQLTGNITSTKKFLTQTGTGTVSAAPAWGTIVAGDIPTMTATVGGGVPTPPNNTTTFLRGDGTFAAAGGGGTPGGADTQIQYNNAGAFGGSANFTWANATNKLTLGGTDTGIIMKTITNEPAIPAAGTGIIYMKNIAGNIMPKFLGPAGVDTPLQSLIGQDHVGVWMPQGNSTALPGVFGFTPPTAVGTVTARTVATTNLFSRQKRLGYVSATTAGSVAGHYVPVALDTIGDGAGNGGFFYISRFGVSDAATVANAQMFVGMSSSVAAPTNVDPGTLTNSIGVGYATADSYLNIFYGGSTAQTRISLGANFPKNTLSTDMYELDLFAAPNSNNTVGYKVVRLNTGAVAEGVLTAATPGTQLPLSTTLLAHRAWRSNGTTALAVGIDVASVYISND